MRNIRMRKIDTLLFSFVKTVDMVKIFENNRKLIVTIILCIIYWCEVNAAANPSTDTDKNGSNIAQVQSRRGQRRRRTTTEDKSYHPRKRHTVSHGTVQRVSKVDQQPSTTQKRATTKHEDRIENWSLEEGVHSAVSEDSTEHTNIKFYIMEHTTPMPLQNEDKTGVRGHRKDRKQKQHDRKSASETALNWLLGTGQENEKKAKTTLEKPKQHDARKSRHRKDMTVSEMPFTKGEIEEKYNISDQGSKKHHRKIKTTDKPSKNMAVENEDTSKPTKKSKLREKPNNDKNSHLRSGGYYDSEKEHRYPKHEYDPARMQYGTMFEDRTMHRGLIGSSEEYEARSKKTQTDKKKIKYLWNPDDHKEHSASKHKYKEGEKGHSDTKHHYFDDKKKHSSIKHKHDENVKDYDEQRQEYNENKKKHKSIKHPSFEDEITEEVHKYREHTGSKHHSNRIHDDKTYHNRSNAPDADARSEFNNEKISYGHSATTEKEEMRTHHESKIYDKIKDIRTGVLSHEDPSSEAEDAKMSTKKVKLRNKSKFEPPEANMKNINILRSTRIYGLQEDNAADRGQEYQEGQEASQEKQNEEEENKNKPIPELVIEDLNPYAIEAQMKQLAKSYNNKRLANVTIEILGRTAEYNNIVLIKLSEFDRNANFRANDDKYIDEKPEKKIIFIVHGLSVAGMRHILYDTFRFNQLMKLYVSFVKTFDIYVIPMANPDGYAATFNSKAGTYWNKNMSPQSGCPGVVLDRNFDVAWNGSLHMSSCSPLYPGPVPFSEPETRAVRDVFHRYSHKLVAYIHLHASTYYTSVFKGDAILYPRGYSDAQTDDDKYIDIKGEVEEVMKNASFQVLSVTVDTLHNWYGKVYGTSVDYASTVYGIPYAMEFAMQLYDYLQDDAMKQIWGRLIPVVFKNIWKNVNSNPDKKKK